MKRVSLLFALVCLFFTNAIHAQTNSGPPMILTPSDTVHFCPPETTPLHAEISPNNPVGQAGIQVTLSDDQYSSVIPIGFSFQFYGDTYSQCVIGSNNYITFDLTYANQASGYVISQPAPSTQAPRKAIMCPWQDILPSSGGIIRYQTIGTAPNRVFIVEYCSIPMFSCTGLIFSDQIKLFETSNIIEMHVVERPLCDWNNGAAIQGLEKDGVTADIIPGRNYTPPGGIALSWTVTNDGYRFTPKPGNQSTTGLNNGYIQEPIPFAPFLMEVTNLNIQWYAEGNSTTPIGTGPDVTVAPPGETYYVAKISSGGQCVGVTFTDTVWFKYGSYHQVIPKEICAGSTYNFYGRTLFKAGQYDTAFYHDDACDTFYTLNLVVNPLPDVTLKNGLNVEICDSSSTILSLENPQSGNTYQWFKDNTPMSGETDTKLTVKDAGQYKVTATTAKGCDATSAVVNLVVHPNPVAKILTHIPDSIICAYDTMTLRAQAGSNYDYRWSPEKPFRGVTGSDGQKVSGVFIDLSTQVVLTVYNQYGCFDSDTTIVQTKPCCDVFVPNAFSPNGDGHNDYFTPHLELGQILVNLMVFDRYGKKVYNNENIKKGWDGRYENGDEAKSDVYMYYMKYTCADGKVYEKRESVTLIR